MVISGYLTHTNENIPKPASWMPKYDAFYFITKSGSKLCFPWLQLLIVHLNWRVASSYEVTLWSHYARYCWTTICVIYLFSTSNWMHAYILEKVSQRTLVTNNKQRSGIFLFVSLTGVVKKDNITTIQTPTIIVDFNLYQPPWIFFCLKSWWH